MDIIIWDTMVTMGITMAKERKLIQDIISIIMDTIHITMDTMDIITENDQLSQDIFVMDTFMERDQQNLATLDIMAITMDFMVFTMDTMDTPMAKQQDLSSEWRIYLTLD